MSKPNTTLTIYSMLLLLSTPTNGRSWRTAACVKLDTRNLAKYLDISPINVARLGK